MSSFFLFPGQGAQHVGMLEPWQDSQRLRQFIELAESELDIPLGRWMSDGPLEQLVQTKHGQPALVTIGCAIAHDLIDAGHAVAGAAGHSLGEITALAVAGVLSITDAIKLAYIRGEAMQQAVPLGEGGMIALLGGEPAAVDALVSEANEVALLVVANLNAPGQVVVSGRTAALDFVESVARDRGVRAVRRLNVSAPFHSPLMQPAADAVRRFLEGVKLHDAAFPVWSNVTRNQHGDASSICDALVQQITEPVRWADQMDSMRPAVDACEVVVELPPGQVLAGLAKRLDPPIEIIAATEIY